MKKTKPGQPASAKALAAALDRLPVAFALFDAGRRLAAWNAPLASLGLLPNSLLRQGTPLAQFQARVSGPAGSALKVSRKRVPPGHLLLTYEDVTEARRARAEAAEALEREAAAAQILKVISGSPADVHPVYDAIVSSAARLCNAKDAVIRVLDGGVLRATAHHGALPFEDFPIGRGTAAGRAAIQCRAIHVLDLQAEKRKFPVGSEVARRHGIHTILNVPLLRDGRAVGVITVRRSEVRRFTEKQIDLLKTFADQAVIAIENARLFNETKEALERQTATAEILSVIARSRSDIQPVLDAVGRNAARLCEANNAVIFRLEGDLLRQVASYGGLPTSSHPSEGLPVDRSRVTGRAVVDRQTTHVHDLAAETSEFPEGSRDARRDGHRTTLSTPLMREGAPIGAILIRRMEVRPFSDKQVALLKTFADQAAIAIENVRLFNELKTSNSSLREALEQQTATGEILRVMSSSPSAIQPVFDAVARKTSQLCNGSYAIVTRFDGELMHLAAEHNARPGSSAPTARLYPRPPGRDTPSARSVLERAVVHIPHADKDPELPQELVRRIGAGSFLAVPLLREGRPIGAIGVSRVESGPFPAKQIELVKVFADQAVIAIENARLFQELQARNRDLTEALEQQTATGEILKVIASATTEVQPVFDIIVRNAAKLGNAAVGFLISYDGATMELAAQYNVDPQEESIYRPAFPRPAARDTMAGRSILDRVVLNLADIQSSDFGEGTKERARRAGYRSALVVPMLRGGVPIGTLNIQRREAGGFPASLVALLKTFADQAVIAIENVRLFNETKEALERQTATAEILKVIASSPSDVQPVFDAVVRSCQRLFGGMDVALNMVQGEQFDRVAFSVSSGSQDDTRSSFPMSLRGENIAGRSMLRGEVVHIEDIAATAWIGERSRDVSRRRGFRSALCAPMMREGQALGSIMVFRGQPGRFKDEQVALLQTFAAQAVIAIENVRLFNETKEALERQTATAEILKVIASSPSDVQPVFDAIVNSTQGLITGKSTVLLLRRDPNFVVAAYAGPEVANLPEEVRVAPLDRDKNFPSRAILDGEIVHVPDWQGDDVIEHERNVGRAFGIRSGLMVPLLREGKGIGAIAVTRGTPGPYHEKEVALLRSFADQAVIAIENVRLFNETKEALERQTATAEILKVISSSPTEIQPVFDVIVERAVRLCGARFGRVYRYDGSHIHMVASHGLSASGLGLLQRVFPRPAADDTIVGRVILTRQPYFIEDVERDATVPPLSRQMIEALATRSQVTIPMLRADEPIGAITLGWAMPSGFGDAQVALLKTFAAQAVIAIENVRLFNATKEALEHQTATAEVLQVISGSVADAKPVFTKILQSCQSLFARGSVALALLGEDDRMHLHLISEDPGRPVEDWRRRFRRAIEAAHPRPARDSIFGHAMHKGQVLYYADVANGADVPSGLRESVELVGTNYSVVFSPLLWEGRGIGALNVVRVPPAPFSEKEIRLLKTFADQAVIAIQNARLFNETKEALERQTATAEILRVISGSPTDVQPVFEAIAQTAHRLFNRSAAFQIVRDGALHIGAIAGFSEEGMKKARSLYPMALRASNRAVRAMREGKVLETTDVQAPGTPSAIVAIARASGFRSIVTVPLLRGEELLGQLSLTAEEVRPRLDDKQRSLLKTFADQAVIAIENVRLFNETREALERQTASAEILRVISSSPTDVQPVFDIIAKRAVTLCNGEISVVSRFDGALLQLAAIHGVSRKGVEALRPVFPMRLDAETLTARAFRARAIMHEEDVQADPRYEQKETALAAGWRSGLAVPMRRGTEVIGVIFVGRSAAGLFAESQVELLKTFADQAVIAIENVRLFKELQERTEALTKSVGQLTALGEVGQAISSTLELDEVLRTIVQRAVQLAGLDAGGIYEYDERAEQFSLQAAEKLEAELVEAVRRNPIRRGDGATGRTAVTLEPIQVPDIEDDSYQGSRKDVLVRAGYRAILAVPLLREDHLLGALQVFRRDPGAFPPEVVELLKTFATQSAMAIQNARLFREIAEKSSQLEEASRHKSQFLASMSHELRTPLNAILGFNEMILGQVYGEVPRDMQEPLEDIQKSGKHLLRLINNVLDLAKIEAGRMELALADYSVQDTVESVRSTLRPLAEAKGLELVASVPQDIPLAYGDGGRIAQCLMNLAGNSLKFTRQGKVEITVQAKNGRLTWRVSDTGIGIPPDKIETLFSEFRQTDATIASEYGGTGLGLSITKKFVEMHGGRIWVESELGKGSAFTLEIPLRVTAP